jgi:hypothetical protein
MPSRCAAIVDPYSSGAFLAPEIQKRDCACIAVQSSELPPVFRSSWRPDDFVETIRHGSSLEQTAAALARHEVRFVLAGSEMGVELADALSQRLGLASNGTDLSAARRNKFLMAQAASKAGVATAKQFCSDNLADLIHWTRAHCKWPIIVKPVAGCASDNVHRCGSEAEIAQAFHKILDQPNVLGLTNEAALIQEFLAGDEYIVDTVSCQGRHRAAAFWRYQKPPSAGQFVCYDAMELMSYQGPLQEKLLACAKRVLNALGIRYGPAHCELMMVGGEPVLIEIGARLSAGINAILSRICGSICALDLTIDAYLEPEKFLAAAATPPPELLRWGGNFFLMPGRAGRLAALPRLAEIQSLASFHKMSIGAKVGEDLPRVAGAVTLVHPDQAVLRQDIENLRAMQENGFYQVLDAR